MIHNAGSSRAAVPSVAEAILPQVVRNFLRDHPGVWIDIQDMDSAAVLRELDDGVGDACVEIPPADADGDGVPDLLDKCMYIPEPTNSDVFGRG